MMATALNTAHDPSDHRQPTWSANHTPKMAGVAVDTAMSALEATGDRALAASIKNAVNPAKALMKWHSRHKAQAEVGDDLDGYLAKKREEWLSDPAVREQVLAKAREEAG